MICSPALMIVFLSSPCEDVGGLDMDLAVAESLASPGRLEQDRPRDPLRRPDLVLSFFEIEPGMTVLDLFSGSGYYTEILSDVVGEDGKVVAHNNQAYLDYAKDALADRFAEGRLANVEQIKAEANDLQLPASTFDAALAVLTWHDFYFLDEENGWPAIDVPSVIDTLCTALKPGAVLGVIDHVAASGSDPRETGQNLHRLDPDRIKSDLEGSCFRFESEISALRNPDDDHAKPMYADGVKGRTDRVVFKFRRL
jgi:predicted methyltransferase